MNLILIFDQVSPLINHAADPIAFIIKKAGFGKLKERYLWLIFMCSCFSNVCLGDCYF